MSCAFQITQPDPACESASLLSLLFPTLHKGIRSLITPKSWFCAWCLLAMVCCLAAPLSAATTGTFGNFTYSDDGTSITITGYPEDAVGSVEIPSTINGKPVTSIGHGAFYYCRGLTSVSISEGVTSIGSEAFYNCNGLTSVSIPAGVTNIGDNAFTFCNSLVSVSLPAGVTSIGNGAFSFCIGLTSVSIPAGVTTSIGSYAFYNCSGLTSVSLPEGVTSIGISAFSSCTRLTSVVIPSTVTSIGSSAFSHCTGLTNVSIPTGVTNIGSYAFYKCSGLTSVSIPAGVTSIADYAFFGCSGLISVSIPAGITSIADYAFSGCYGLTSVSIPSSVTSIGYGAFAGCSGLTNVTIPTGVTSIGNGVFKDCTGLTSVAIPSSVTTIGSDAFANCYGLTNVTIPASVTSIAGYAFWNCKGLTSASFMGNAPTLGSDAFASVASGFKIYYLDSSSGFTSPIWQGYPAQAILEQTITFGPLSGKTYGDAPFTLSATASSGLTPTFSILSGPATISGNTVTLTGAGTVIVRASQAGSAGYLTADPVDQSFTVAKSGQTITFTQPSDHLFGDAPFTLSATASSGLTPTFSVVSGPATISGDTLTLTGAAGTVTVRASQAGNENYLAASVDRSFTVSKPTRTQSISFKPPAKALMTAGTLTLTATSSSGLPVSFTVVSGPATLGDDGRTLTLTGAGSVVVQATQSGNEVYLPASTVQKTIQVSRVSQKITFAPPATAFMTVSPLTLTATSSSGLPVSFTVVSGPATLGDDGRTLTLTGAGIVVVKATQTGNAVYLPAPAVQKKIKVSRVAQKITFTPPATVAMSDSPLTLTATASSGLPVTFTVSGPAILEGQTLTLTGVGKVTVKASQPGNAVYNAAATITKTITVTAAVAQNLVGKSIAPTVGTLDGAHAALLVGSDASPSAGQPVGTFDLQVDTAQETYTAILTMLDGSDPLFISGTVEAGGTDANPLVTAHWPEPGATGPFSVEFSLSGDGLVVTVSLDDEIIAETEAGVMTK